MTSGKKRKKLTTDTVGFKGEETMKVSNYEVLRKSGCWKIVAGPPEVHMNKNWLGDGGGSQEVCGD